MEVTWFEYWDKEQSVNPSSIIRPLTSSDFNRRTELLFQLGVVDEDIVHKTSQIEDDIHNARNAFPVLVLRADTSSRVGYGSS